MSCDACVIERDHVSPRLTVVIFLLLGCLVMAFPALQAQATEIASAYPAQKNVLFINSYSYEFDTVPIVLNEVAPRLKGVASVQYQFMDEKYLDDTLATRQRETADVLTAKSTTMPSSWHDAAFDFAISHRDRTFGYTSVYANVNSAKG